MSGFVDVKEGSVKIDHYSTASVIKITIEQETFNQKGETEKFNTELWLEYSEFSDLKKAVNKTDDWL